MSLERKILTITKPTLPIEQMDMADTSEQTIKKHKLAGAIWPIVEINNYQFNEDEIDSLYLDETGFMPKIRIGVMIHNGIFMSKYFPKDGDPMSLFIRSKTDEFKPIRCDFEITLINAMPSLSETGDVQHFTIEGVLRIPGIYADWCKSFKEKTSYDTLIDVCNELKVGFASNETSTSDKMTWINSFDTYEKFLKDITSASYKDDDSFFKSYFDHYYHLNFVNMNNQFTDEVNIEDALEVLNVSDDFIKSENYVTKSDTKIILGNHKALKGTGNFILGYTLTNKAGQVFIDNGYRRYLQYYDFPLNETKFADKYKSYFVEPLNTKGTKDKVLLRGRTNEDFFSKYNKYKWMGSQYELPSGNCHENYFQAVLQNKQNNEEIEKMILKINLGKCNFNLYRGQMVPVVILNIGNTRRQKQTLDDAQDVNNETSLDKFLSGTYMIHAINYSWSSETATFTQHLELSRREWPMPNVTIPK